MKHATLSWLAALSLLGSATFAAAQQPGRAPQAPAAAPSHVALRAAAPGQPAQAQPPQAPQGGPAPQTQQAPQAQPQAQPPAQPQAPQAGQARPAPGGTRAERRRRSYASCNRASHQRGLHGGKRRRFLIRCRLGYERPRQPAAAQPGPRP